MVSGGSVCGDLSDLPAAMSFLGHFRGLPGYVPPGAVTE